MKRLFPLFLALVLLCGCTAPPAKTEEAAPRRYEATFLTLFDTVTTIVGYAETEADFTATAQALQDELLEYHQLYDIYNEYEGMNNLKTVNDHAGQAPVPVDRKIIDLLLFSKELYTRTGGKVNIAMGSVLSLWHDARELGIESPDQAALPDRDALEQAAAHTGIDSIQIDEENGTVFFTDPEVRLDVGAIAKGWAAQRVSQLLPEGYMLNVGGNVCTRGTKPGGAKWNIAIQSPNAGEDNLCVVGLAGQSLVTSGDYQRSYIVEGKSYHHIIDPDTLMPSAYWRSVSILCDDSGLADCLSTALFLLPLEEGRILAEQCGAEVMWVDADMNITQTPGFVAALRP